MKLKKNIFLEGKKIYLRTLSEKDIEGNYAKWFNDAEVTKYNSHGRFPMTVEKMLKFVEESVVSNSFLVFAVVLSKTDEHVGNISLQNINWIDRNAEIAYVLGEKDVWGKGIMYEASKLLMDHGFRMLNLHRIYCGTSSENKAMQRLAEKLNMKEEGLRKEALYKNGRYADIKEYGILKKDFYR